jgi:hypothetical protein
VNTNNRRRSRSTSLPSSSSSSNDDEEQEATANEANENSTTTAQDEHGHRSKRLRALLEANVYQKGERIDGTFFSILQGMAYEANADLAAYLFHDARSSRRRAGCSSSSPSSPERQNDNDNDNDAELREQGSSNARAASTSAERGITRNPMYEFATRYWTRFPLRPDDIPPPEWTLADEILGLRDKFSTELGLIPPPRMSSNVYDEQPEQEAEEEDEEEEEEDDLSDVDVPESLEEPLLVHVASAFNELLRGLAELKAQTTTTADEAALGWRHALAVLASLPQKTGIPNSYVPFQCDTISRVE